VNELRAKGTEITEEEAIAVKAGILLHDVGHGPFSHALENKLLQNLHHENLSLKIMQAMNEDLGGQLNMCIDIFSDKYPKKFLHQLISGQLDVDRMDYLTRDSFFTGVSEGVIGYDRILKMLVVHNGELMVEEKGIYSIEKFLVARRQMYWQAYLHKTVLSAEVMLVNVLKRVKELFNKGVGDLLTGSTIDSFLFYPIENDSRKVLENFCRLDDVDISFAVKKWSLHADFVLKELCSRLLNRQLLKIKLQSHPFNKEEVQKKLEEAAMELDISQADAGYFVFTGEANNTMYKTQDERINILFKDGSVKDISAIDNPLIHQTISAPIKKFYICALR
jgi:HD superfamily phosphohydrolase